MTGTAPVPVRGADAFAQTPPQAGPPYEPILLASKLGEMCSQCTAALLCTPLPETTVPPTIYVFPEKTFWQQIMTIPTYLPFIGKPQVDTRPVVVHRPATNEAGMTGEAGLDFAAATVRVPDALIERRTGVWRDPTGVALGACRPAGRRFNEARTMLTEAGR